MVNYNVNELLERKKELEGQLKEKLGLITSDDLKYRKEIRIDHTNSDKENEYVPRPRVGLTDFVQRIFGIVDELERVKTSIQKYNAENILGELQRRESNRCKIAFLDSIKRYLSRNVEHNRTVSRQDREGSALESFDMTVESMFSIDDVDKMHDQFAAQERKINTEIQKKNLEAEIEL